MGTDAQGKRPIAGIRFCLPLEGVTADEVVKFIETKCDPSVPKQTMLNEIQNFIMNDAYAARQRAESACGEWKGKERDDFIEETEQAYCKITPIALSMFRLNIIEKWQNTKSDAVIERRLIRRFPNKIIARFPENIGMEGALSPEKSGGVVGEDYEDRIRLLEEAGLEQRDGIVLNLNDPFLGVLVEGF